MGLHKDLLHCPPSPPPRQTHTHWTVSLHLGGFKLVFNYTLLHNALAPPSSVSHAEMNAHTPTHTPAPILRPRPPQGGRTEHRQRQTPPPASPSPPPLPSKGEGVWTLETWGARAQRANGMGAGSAVQGGDASLTRLQLASSAVCVETPCFALLSESVVPQLGVLEVEAQRVSSAVTTVSVSTVSLHSQVVYSANSTPRASVSSTPSAPVVTAVWDGDDIVCTITVLSAAVAWHRAVRCAQSAALQRKLRAPETLIVLPPRSRLLDRPEGGDGGSEEEEEEEEGEDQEEEEGPPLIKTLVVEETCTFQKEDVPAQSVSLHTVECSGVPEVDPVWRRTGGTRPVMRIA